MTLDFKWRHHLPATRLVLSFVSIFTLAFTFAVLPKTWAGQKSDSRHLRDCTDQLHAVCPQKCDLEAIVGCSWLQTERLDKACANLFEDYFEAYLLWIVKLKDCSKEPNTSSCSEASGHFSKFHAQFDRRLKDQFGASVAWAWPSMLASCHAFDKTTTTTPTRLER